jgi:lipopolysaccharide export system permease protein
MPKDCGTNKYPNYSANWVLSDFIPFQVKKLHAYMIRSYIGPLVMTFCLAMIVLILQFVWKYIDELVGKGLSTSVILELITYVSASLIPMALILAVLLSSIMTFGNLGEHSELNALKSSGISLTRIMTPLFVLGVAITFGAFLFSNYTIPKTNMKFFTLLLDIRKQRPEFDIKEGQFYNGLEGYSLKIGKRSKESRMLYDLMIYDHTAKIGNASVILADSGFLVQTEDKRNLMLTLYSGYGYAEQLDENLRLKKTKPFRRDKFAMQQILFTLPSNELDRTEEDLFKDNFKRKNMAELSDYVANFKVAMVNKRERVSRDLLQTQYFKLLDKKDTLTPLSEKQQELAVNRIDVNQLFDTLPANEKTAILDYALSLARTSQGMVKTSAEVYKSDQSWMYRYQIEWHRKLTMSLACLIFFLIGAPLGAIIRKGGLGTPVVVSTLLFIFYHIISLAGEKYARAGIMPVWLGMWGSTFILLCIGVYLTIKSTRDSSIMSGETYTLLIRKFFRFGRQNGTVQHENPPVNQ